MNLQPNQMLHLNFSIIEQPQTISSNLLLKQELIYYQHLRECLQLTEMNLKLQRKKMN